MFGEEVDFAALYPQDVLLQVDTGLVGLEHVQAEEEVYGFTLCVLRVELLCSIYKKWNLAYLHDGECTGKEEVCQLQLGAVYPPEDLGGTYAHGRPRKSRI